MPIAVDTPVTPQDETATTVEPKAVDQQAAEPETDEALVEEVSIDGMCGVY